MKTIWKYRIKIDEELEVKLPVYSDVVHFEWDASTQSGWFWIEQHKIKADQIMLFKIYGTGFDIPEEAEHCGTVRDGEFVWHLYWKRLRTANDV